MSVDGICRRLCLSDVCFEFFVCVSFLNRKFLCGWLMDVFSIDMENNDGCCMI